MIIADQIRNKLAATECGIVLTMADFGIVPQYQSALVKALNRLVGKGDLQKIAKGKYYKPKKTVFGTIRPTTTEVIKDFLEEGGETVGYITGTAAFASMGLTTQISSRILIGTNTYRRPLERGGNKVSFLLQENEITEENIPLLRILDAIKFIKEIPATTPDETIKVLKTIIENLSSKQCKMLINLVQKYTPYVKAILGAILDLLGYETKKLKAQLNGVTYYKLPISVNTLPNKKDWNIL